jgi:MFS family permease
MAPSGKVVVISNNTVMLLRMITAATAVSDGYDLGVINGVSMILAKTYTNATISFFVSMLPALVAVGAFLGAYLADKFGRKKILIGSYLLLILGPVIMSIPSSLGLIFFGRAVVGLGIGIGGVTGTVYMAEIAPTKSRGSLVGQEALFLSFGLLLGYLSNYLLIGYEHDYHIMLSLGAVIPTICLVVLLFAQKILPESPHWERLQQGGGEYPNETHAAATDREWNLGNDENILKKFLASPGAVSAILVGTLQPLCGVGPILYFSDLTFSQAEVFAHLPSDSEPYIAMSSIYIGITKMAVLMVSALILMDYVGRKTLLLISSALLTVSMGFISLILLRAPEKKALLLAGFCAAIGSYAFGWNCVTSVYPSELLPTNVRTFGLSFVTILGRFITVGNSFLYPIIGLTHTAGWFITFTVINVVAFALVYFFAIETFNKPLMVRERKHKAGTATPESDREDFVHHTDTEQLLGDTISRESSLVQTKKLE